MLSGSGTFPGSTVVAEADGFKLLISGSTSGVVAATGISATANYRFNCIRSINRNDSISRSKR
jgi:hypothetical protein